MTTLTWAVTSSTVTVAASVFTWAIAQYMVYLLALTLGVLV